MQKRVLIFRSAAIGDIIHCLPTVKFIKSKNPDAIVDLVIATPSVKPLLELCCPYINKIYVVHKHIPDSKELMDSLKEHPVDDFVYLHSHWWRSFLWNMQHIKAKKVWQYTKDIRFSAVENFALTYYPELRKDFMNASWLKYLDYQTLDKSKIQIDKNEDDYICLAVAVGKVRPTRAYPVRHWKRFIRHVLLNTNYKIKLLGGHDEHRLSEYLTHSLKGYLLAEFSAEEVNKFFERIENCVAQTDMLGLAKILCGAKHIFSGDTGILHIASALDLPVTSVYSISSEWRTGPFSPKAKVIRSKSCLCKPDNSNSRRHCSNLKNGYASCLWDIDPQEVFASLEEASQEPVMC